MNLTVWCVSCDCPARTISDAVFKKDAPKPDELWIIKINCYGDKIHHKLNENALKDIKVIK